MTSSPKTAASTPSPGVDPAYIEQLHQQWQNDPASVPESWQSFFAGMAFAAERGPGQTTDCDFHARAAHMQSNVASLIYAYRSQGHLLAKTDPLGSNLDDLELLDYRNWEFTEDDLDQVFDTGHLGAPNRLPLREIIDVLQQTYCRSIGIEYIHIQDRQIRRWIQEQFEPVRGKPERDGEAKQAVLDALVDAEQFESFTHSRYLGQKRFSLEGAETLIPALRGLIEAAPDLGCEEIVFGMAHRGRLNVLCNIIGQSYEEVFNEFEGRVLPSTVQGDGDVKYHKGYSTTYDTRSGRSVHLTLTANPSHLEAVDPVVQGRARAKQRQRGDTHERKRVLPLLIHGDAAFAGQGVVAETFNLSQLAGYRTGGTVHIIVNNQIGFTTLPQDARSSPYPTDMAKMIEAPILHVNGDDPEAAVFAVELALGFRQRFHRDVVVDLVCYRRHGHNEGDDPAFTQPHLYDKIKNRPTVRLLYMQQLVDEGVLTQAQADESVNEFRAQLEQALEKARAEESTLSTRAFSGRWRGLDARFSFDPVHTAADPESLAEVAQRINTVPEGFQINPKVARQLPKRLQAFRAGGPIDWAFAEALAWGTLLEDTPVRLSGQDSQRGTFSQRHAVWKDIERNEEFIPLNNLSEYQSRFCVYNSSLSEAAVLGFEYGYSLSEPDMLIMWEGQFGDFVNGAQVIIDQFLTSAASKWQRDSGIVLLLPHGNEGQGPEHSNAYLERFLAACAEYNLQVCNLTTPAQYFHLLRRQIKRKFRLPLVLMTPKSMLRHKRAVSQVSELTSGTFEEILPDPKRPARTRRLLLCSGKVYWDLAVKRRKEKVDDVAIFRVEQIYPLHEEKLRQLVGELGEVEEVVWVQEESQNRGAWSHLFPRLLELFPAHYQRGKLSYVGRQPAASPASGSLKIHREEQDALVHEAICGSLADR
ncbi:MAG: 2-oxoglutarate dehydrogenase E1 component [Deltaproteobacteria bacterium]|nr:MAG: 2-oxoglutarate dehydrogenase E1 component [Deltaproteobacteria bacterium]